MKSRTTWRQTDGRLSAVHSLQTLASPPVTIIAIPVRAGTADMVLGISLRFLLVAAG